MTQPYNSSMAWFTDITLRMYSFLAQLEKCPLLRLVTVIYHFTGLSMKMSAVCSLRRGVIEEGDLVIVFQSYDQMSLAKVEAGKCWLGKPGTFKMDRFIGKPFGARLQADHSPGGRRGRPFPRGWIVLLEPTPQLWTLGLSHRTQIIYQTDIAYILLHLEVSPGSRVIESGTGSGSMSLSLAQAIAPHGHLFTFEFNEERFKGALEDFAKLGITEMVTVTHRNVIEHGFGLNEIEPESIDAVFLDLPAPWHAIDSAALHLREGGKICSFSPCIEQVQRTCAVLREKQFSGTLFSKLVMNFGRNRDVGSLVSWL